MHRTLAVVAARAAGCQELPVARPCSASC